MSDLIERLKEDLKWMTGYDYPDQKEVSSLLTKSDLIEAISALETVRGIEEILSIGSGEVFIDGLSLPGKIVVSISSDKDVVIEPTLSAAVEAARKQ